MQISSNLKIIHKQILAAEVKYDRPKAAVKLLAVSKKKSTEAVLAAFKAGQVCFGENYVQEALPKIHALAQYPLEWHFIGPIQSNKTKLLAENFAWVQSVDRLKIAERLGAHRPAALGPLNICLQVNISGEATKSGISLEELPKMARELVNLPNLRWRGLMTIPAAEENFARQRQTFKKLQLAFQQLQEQGYQIDTLSMGMSNDFVAAIAEGSTLVRIGSAIFGARD